MEFEFRLNPFFWKDCTFKSKVNHFLCQHADGIHLILSTRSVHQIKTIFCISILEVVLHGGLFQVMEWLCKIIPGAGKTGGEHNDPGDGYHFLSVFSTSSCFFP